MKLDQKVLRPGYNNLTHPSSARISRRRFIRRTGRVAAGLALGSLLPSGLHAARRNRRLPTPVRSGIEHIVVVMMENRSFDHFIGWLPGADGRQAGLTYRDSAGAAHQTASLSGE